MKRLVSCAEARALDANIQESRCVSADILMENAASGMYAAIKQRYGTLFLPESMVDSTVSSTDAPSIVALCGAGNNGGDALAVLRHALFDGAQNIVAVLAAPLDSLGEQTGRRLAEARASGALILDSEDTRVPLLLTRARLILDGLTGTGAHGPLRGPSLSLANLRKQAAGVVVAVDIPSGLFEISPSLQFPVDSFEAVRASVSLTVAPIKSLLFFPGNRPACGEIVEINGVFPSDSGSGSPMCLLEESDLSRFLPPLLPDMHKGNRGNLGIYAGSAGSTGAPILAAKAGAASGAGTVTLMLRDEIYPLLVPALTGIMARPLAQGSCREYQAQLIGPGLGMDETGHELLDACWSSDTPLVVDADALRMLGSRPARERTAFGSTRTVLAPHPGEMAAIVAGCGLMDPASADLRLRFNTYELCLEVSRRFDAVVVLKASASWIVHPDGRAAVFDGRCPALATGGSGDVLAGALAGLLARGGSPFEAACAAVLAHGMAGRVLARDTGFFDALELTVPLASLLYAQDCRKRKHDGNPRKR